MKRFRFLVVLLLSLAVPIVASAGVRMQLAMNPSSAHPIMGDMSMSMSMPSGDGGCDMAATQADVPGKSMPCCQDKSGQGCKICNLPASVAASITGFCQQTFSQFVLVSTEIVRFSDGISGLWRPPRQL